ncbi:MAG: glycosyltransferase, partial [Candidatus Woesearchaeota archaeon]
KRIWNGLFKIIRYYKKITFRNKLKLAKKLGYKIIYTVHNIKPHEKDKKTEKNTKILYRLADKIVVMGEHDKEYLEKNYDLDNISLIPHFHYKQFYKNKINKKDARNKLGIKGDKFTFLFFGSIREYKNVDGLINAFRNIEKDIRLIIAGNSSQDPNYINKIKRMSGKDKRIIVKNRKIPNNNIQIYMNASNVVVFPFNQVSNSGSLLLAKSFYKPTICVDKGNLKEYTNPKTDIMIKDNSDLKKALLSAMEKKFPKDKKEYLKRIPSLKKVAKMYKEIY